MANRFSIYSFMLSRRKKRNVSTENCILLLCLNSFLITARKLPPVTVKWKPPFKIVTEIIHPYNFNCTNVQRLIGTFYVILFF